VSYSTVDFHTLWKCRFLMFSNYKSRYVLHCMLIDLTVCTFGTSKDIQLCHCLLHWLLPLLMATLKLVEFG